MKTYGFYVDSQRCTGCKTCQVACKDLHNHSKGINFRRVYEYAGGDWQQEGQVLRHHIFAYYLSIACNHCEDPACARVCPSGAMHKQDNGLVVVNEKVCIGCKSCIMACLYGAPQYDEEKGHVVKCDACQDRVAVGEKPVCVASCPYRALDFGPMDELEAKYGKSVNMAPLPSTHYTNPNLIVKPGPTARPVGDTTGSIVNPKEV